MAAVKMRISFAEYIENLQFDDKNNFVEILAVKLLSNFLSELCNELWKDLKKK